VGIGTSFWGNAIFKRDIHTVGLDFEFIPLAAKNLPLFLSLTGIFLAIILNSIIKMFQTKESEKNNYNILLVSYPQSYVFFVWFLFHKWYFDYIYNYYLGYTILQYSYYTFYKLIDKGLIEILSLQGLNIISYKLSLQISRTQLGAIYNLNCFLFLGLILLFITIFCI
jgi:hypothetical protein